MPDPQTSPLPPTDDARSTDKVTVVHLIHTMAYGGIETIVINWLRDVDPDKFDMRVVCFSNPGGGGTEDPFVEAAEQAGITVQKIGWHRGKPIFKAAAELETILRDCNASIVHTHNTYADVVGWLAARNVGAKTVGSLYVWGEFGLKRNILQFIDTKFLRRFDHVTCQCEKTQADTIGRGIAADKVSVLDAGFPVSDVELSAEQRNELRREFGATDQNVVLLNVARLYPEKAHSFLLDAYQQLRSRRPEAKLWIAGVGPLEEELKQQCTSMGLDPYVTWLGFRENLSELFALADIQIHPSTNEGIPLALLHGMASAMPIVATAVGGIPEVLKDGKTALLIPPSEEKSFLAAIEAMMDQPANAKAMGQAAQHFIVEQYGQQQAVERLSMIYDNLLAKHR